MHRLFVALRPPAAIRALLAEPMAGVPGARWQDDAQLHLTLRFLGELPGDAAEEAALALSRIDAAPVALQLTGVGAFTTKGRAHTLWAGVAPSPTLSALHARVAQALIRCGLPPEARRFMPHVTLARMARGDGGHPAVAAWQVRHVGFASAPFTCDRFALYESALSRDGATYTPVAHWRLTG